MTQATDQDFQRLVLERLDKLDSDITGLKQETRDTNTKFDAYVKASEKVERLATTIIVTAGTVTLLSPLLQAIAPTVRAFLGGAA
jgi:hypothetical protein